LLCFALLLPRLRSLSLSFIHAFIILPAHRSISAEEEEAVAQRLKSPASKASNHERVQATRSLQSNLRCMSVDNHLWWWFRDYRSRAPKLQCRERVQSTWIL
jgi:hypothetical protein